MKGFIASVVTLCILIGLIVWNGIWLHRTMADLLDRTKSLESATAEEREALSSELFEKWKKCRKALSITVSHTEIESIDSRIVSLKAYAKDGEDGEFYAALAQLREELEFLHRSESLTVEGII